MFALLAREVPRESFFLRCISSLELLRPFRRTVKFTSVNLAREIPFEVTMGVLRAPTCTSWDNPESWGGIKAADLIV